MEQHIKMLYFFCDFSGKLPELYQFYQNQYYQLTTFIPRCIKHPWDKGVLCCFYVWDPYFEVSKENILVPFAFMEYANKYRPAQEAIISFELLQEVFGEKE